MRISARGLLRATSAVTPAGLNWSSLEYSSSLTALALPLEKDAGSIGPVTLVFESEAMLFVRPVDQDEKKWGAWWFSGMINTTGIAKELVQAVTYLRQNPPSKGEGDQNTPDIKTENRKSEYVTPSAPIVDNPSANPKKNSAEKHSEQSPVKWTEIIAVVVALGAGIISLFALKASQDRNKFELPWMMFRPEDPNAGSIRDGEDARRKVWPLPPNYPDAVVFNVPWNVINGDNKQAPEHSRHRPHRTDYFKQKHSSTQGAQAQEGPKRSSHNVFRAGKI